MKSNRNESIIKKIRGLLAIANDNKSDEESQSAFLLAQKLMVKHDIALSEISNESEKEEIKDGQATAYKKLFWWERTLAGIIASNFKVEYYYNNKRFSGEKRRKSAVIFFGYESDVQLAKEMYILAYDAILLYSKRFVDNYYNEDEYAFRTVGKTNDLKNSYIRGFLDGLESKFKEQLIQMKEEFGLMVIKPKEVSEAYEELSKTFGKAHKLRIPDVEEFLAYRRGRDEGNSIDYTKSSLNDEVIGY
ncbi:DUF2786 domain-containing protein [Bacillus licheniformis]|uniref:DUF2786 domain-containing protein n=1 Tax=Bacillus licheniformis TaxID=1402 RepID=UPI000F5F059C|nr:DUF2786 domain-containing protein [Bacillus licheniformis]RRD95617.1 DUF2786 domain-containing protein [Bacillus licheniformis]